MKFKRLAGALLVSLWVGAWLGSCSPHDLDIEPILGDETGFLALGIGINGVGNVQTRAADPSYNHPSEYALHSLRIILYDNGTGLSVDVADYYNIQYVGPQQWSYQVRPSGAAVDPTFSISGEVYDPQMTKHYANIDRTSVYKLLVIANPFESDGTGGSAHLDKIILSDYSTLLTATSAAGHALSLVERAIIDYNEAQYGGSANTIYDNVAATWMGIKNLSYPNNLGYAGKMNTASFMMFNADNEYNDPSAWMQVLGLPLITAGNIRPSLNEALQFPVRVRLERGVAKVIVADGTTLLSHGATVSNVRWACDILNRKSYILRKGITDATANGLEREALFTPQSKRYALDPNHNGASMERWLQESWRPVPPPLANNFFRFAAGDQDGLFSRTWVTDVDNPNDFNWEYVPENTVYGEDQYLDVITRVLVRCDYHPALSQYLGANPGADVNGSYYSYKGLVFSITDMNELASSSGAGIEAKVEAMAELYKKLELLSLTDVLSDVAARSSFGGFIAGGPASSVSHSELHFHYGSRNFYAVPIRHFDDKQMPLTYDKICNEGRYGVVRNNVYKISITNISGPGSAVIPEPKGYSDRELSLAALFTATPWNTVALNFDF